MIKFFRRIRQQLVSQNKFSKYLIYAIGEIVLVVIGILIALQINNWNEEKKNQVAANNYKERLIRQFRQDSVLLSKYNRANNLFQPMFAKVDSLFKENNQKNMPVDSIIKVPIFITLQSEFISATTAIDELFNTGRLDLFKNDSLKDFLAGYKNLIEQQHDMINRSQNKFDAFDNFLAKVSTLTNREYLIQAGKINSDYFMNLYWFIKATRDGHNQHFNAMQKMNNDILTILRKDSQTPN